MLISHSQTSVGQLNCNTFSSTGVGSISTNRHCFNLIILLVLPTRGHLHMTTFAQSTMSWDHNMIKHNQSSKTATGWERELNDLFAVNWPICSVRIAIKRIYTSAKVPAEGSFQKALKESILAILLHEEQLMKALTDEQYQFQCPWMRSSIGQHVRHSLDHLRKPLENSNDVVRYDFRDRNTDVENRVEAAKKALNEICERVETLGKWDRYTVRAQVGVIDRHGPIDEKYASFVHAFGWWDRMWDSIDFGTGNGVRCSSLYPS